MEAQQGTTTGNDKQQQATSGNGKQWQATTSNNRQQLATASNSKHRQAMTGNDRQRQATASNDRQRPTSVSKDRQQGTTTDNALPVCLLPALHRGCSVPDIPQYGNVRQLLQVLDTVGFQGDVPVPISIVGKRGTRAGWVSWHDPGPGQGRDTSLPLHTAHLGALVGVCA